MGAMSQVAHEPESGLSTRDAAILDFEASWWSASGAKEAEIRQRFDLSAPAYYQIMNGLLDSEAALAHQPLLVKRLRRLRRRRQQERSARHLTVRATV